MAVGHKWSLPSLNDGTLILGELVFHCMRLRCPRSKFQTVADGHLTDQIRYGDTLIKPDFGGPLASEGNDG